MIDCKYRFTDQVSLSSQFRACSQGNLRVQASEYGVIDVRVNARASDNDVNAMVNAAQEEALNVLARDYGANGLDRLSDAADFVFYITPEMNFGLAFATVFGGTSVYNNLWGSYLGSMMHEIGYVTTVVDRSFG